MKNICTVTLFIIALLLIFSCLTLKNKIELLLEARFEPILKNYIDDRNIPGFAIAVVNENKLVYR